MAEQPAPVRVGHFDLAESRTVDAGDAVMPGEPFVHERVVGVQELEDAPVAAQDVGEQQLGLAPERLANVVIEIRELQDVRAYLRFEVAQLQPLSDEVADYTVR